MWWRRRPDDSPASQPASPQEALEERLSAYLDDEVTAEERAEVEAILAADPAAREHLDDLRLLTSAYASLGEVRAPRSFAIPAPSGAAAPSGAGAPSFRANGGGSVLAFRRMEWAVRASAAAAALLFVVALATDVGNTPTQVPGIAMSAESEAPSASFAAPEARSAGGAGGAETEATAAGDAAGNDEGEDGDVAPGGAALVPPQPRPSDGDATDGPSGGSEPSAGEDGDQGMGTMAVPGEGATPPEGAEDDDAKQADLTMETATYEAPESGTVGRSSASQGVGGVAAALATLAALLTGISVLLARTREAGPADHR